MTNEGNTAAQKNPMGQNVPIHSWPYCLWELKPTPFYLNTMARGLSYASGRGQRRGQLIPEANYLA